jgi:hypothetical protein
MESLFLFSYGHGPKPSRPGEPAQPAYHRGSASLLPRSSQSPGAHPTRLIWSIKRESDPLGYKTDLNLSSYPLRLFI